MKQWIVAACVFFASMLTLCAQPVLPAGTAISQLKKDIPALMQKADIPGMSVALIRDGKIAWTGSFGVMNADTKENVTVNSVFEAASLSKMVFAYAVLKLVDQGKLDLDTPLNKYLGNNYDVGDDSRLDLITARHVLSHTTGFPNWRESGEKILPIKFTPGEKFGYSGEGFVYLAKVVEGITGMSMEDFMQQTVLSPMGMAHSSYIWQPQFDSLAVHRHNLVGQVFLRNKSKFFNAAASLRTTATDYAKFVLALLNGQGLQPATWKQMLTPQVYVSTKAPGLSWGLGVGLEETNDGKSLWHWGDQPGNKAYVTADIERKNAIVYFTNSENGLSIIKELLTDAIGEDHPGLNWLNPEKYDFVGRVLLKKMMTGNASEILAGYAEQRKLDTTKLLSQSQMNTLGQRLLDLKMLDAALLVFQQNTIDFPNSSNTWSSFAEAYMIKGNKELAIKNYEKAIELNPANTKTAEQLKRLREH